MTYYKPCLCCESAIDPKVASFKVTVDNRVIAVVCSTCLMNIKTFRTSFTRDNLTDTHMPLQFQCLEEFTVPRNADIEP